MTEREADAIRELMAVLRSDFGTMAKVLAAMIERGFTAEETQAALMKSPNAFEGALWWVGVTR